MVDGGKQLEWEIKAWGSCSLRLFYRNLLSCIMWCCFLVKGAYFWKLKAEELEVEAE